MWKKNLPNEIDFCHEAKNCERCGEIFLKDEDVVVPKLYKDYISQRILTMSFEDGISVGKVSSFKKLGIEPTEVAGKISKVFNEMIFTHGFIHVDPHPGNIFVRKDQKGRTKLILFDHGVYQNLDNQT